MRRPLLLVAAVTIAACGGFTSESQPASPYEVSVFSQSHSGGGRVSPYITNLTLLVGDTGTHAAHPGVGITLQVDVGNITAGLPPALTDGAGHILVTWSIDTADQDIGATHTLAYCAVPPGRTFCKTSLIGPDVITAGPF